uniref:Uncharacterized protein n=1 Tax=Eptatretus burgeri TaxID=7764 RepID=A0A8C4WVQ0_EPTBU
MSSPSFRTCAVCSVDVETRHWNIANVTSHHVLDTSGELGAALLIAGIVQVVFGIAAIAGRVSAVCGPLVLAPSISLLGLAGYQQSATFSGEHWGLATGTITLMLICSQYLGGVYVPLPRCLSACSIRLPLLRLFSVLLPAGLVWIVCIALGGAIAPDTPRKPLCGLHECGRWRHVAANPEFRTTRCTCLQCGCGVVWPHARHTCLNGDLGL